MRIKSVYLRRYRGLERASLPACAALNVLIGRNNAGKSSILSAIELALDRLQNGRVASIWSTPRPSDEFTNRIAVKPLQIGVTFEANEILRADFQLRLLDESPGLDVAVSQLSTAEEFSVIFAADIIAGNAVIYLQELGVGCINSANDELTLSGTRIVSVSHSTAQELGKRENGIKSIEAEIRALDDLPSGMFDYIVKQKAEGAARWRNFGGERISSRRLIALIDDYLAEAQVRRKLRLVDL